MRPLACWSAPAAFALLGLAVTANTGLVGGDVAHLGHPDETLANTVSLTAAGLAAALLAARAAMPVADRITWALLGAGAAAWWFGDLYWLMAFGHTAEPPFPSIADGLYLAFFPPAYAGLVLLLRGRVRHFHASQWLDGAAATLLFAAIAVAVVMPAVVATSEGSVAAIATNIAYPVGDVVVLGLVLVVFALTGWRPGRAIAVVAAGCAVFAVADVLFFLRAAAGAVEGSGASEILWLMGLALMAVGAWLPQAERTPARFQGWRVMALPAAVALVALAILVHDLFADGGVIAPLLAIGALLVCIARAGLTFRENIALAQTAREAVIDALTGLPNRRLFLDRAERALEEARRREESVAVMIIDLDRFKEVNDTLGHAAGDEMLQLIGGRLTGAVRATDTVARLGGDEFAVLLPGLGDRQVAEAIAHALTTAIGQPMMLRELAIDAEASIGVAFSPEHGDEVSLLLQRADVAMYAAKAARVGHALYREEQDGYSPERLALVGELRRALGENELRVLYQPKVDLAAGGVVSAEVLIRWQHPTRGLLPPSEFIPVAEMTSLMRPLTLHVLNRALLQARDWLAEGHDISIAVNVSARSLIDPAFADDVESSLALWQVPPSALELEVTETELMSDPERARQVLARLRVAGVRIAIDDYGTGYSSLEYLKNLPVDVLKIDRSFVMNMTRDDADAMIVRSTIDLARNLGLRVVAEGIEDDAAADALRALGCHVGQGFLFGRPMPAGDFELLLPASPRAAAALPAG